MRHYARAFLVALTLAACATAPSVRDARMGLGVSLTRRGLPERVGLLGDGVAVLRRRNTVEVVAVATGEVLATYESVGSPVVLDRRGEAVICATETGVVAWVERGGGAVVRVDLGLASTANWQVVGVRESVTRPRVFFLALRSSPIAAGGGLACCGGGEAQEVPSAQSAAVEVDFDSRRVRALEPGSVLSAVTTPAGLTTGELAGLTRLDVHHLSTDDPWLQPVPPRTLVLVAERTSGAAQVQLVGRTPGGIVRRPTGLAVSPVQLRGAAVSSSLVRIPDQPFFADSTLQFFLHTRCLQEHTAAPVVCEAFAIPPDGRAQPVHPSLVEPGVPLAGAPLIAIAEGLLLRVEQASELGTEGMVVVETLSAFDLETGEVRWRRELSRDAATTDVAPTPQ